MTTNISTNSPRSLNSSEFSSSPTRTYNYFVFMKLTPSQFLVMSCVLETIYTIFAFIWFGWLIYHKCTLGEDDKSTMTYICTVIGIGLVYTILLNWWPFLLLCRVKQIYNSMFNEGTFQNISTGMRIFKESNIILWLMRLRILFFFAFSFTKYAPFPLLNNEINEMPLYVALPLLVATVSLLLYTTCALTRLHRRLQMHLENDHFVDGYSDVNKDDEKSDQNQRNSQNWF